MSGTSRQRGSAAAAPGKSSAPRRPAARRSDPRRAGSRKVGWGRWLLNAVATLVGLAVIVPAALAVVYRFAPPPITILMIERLIQGHGLDHRWTPISQMSPALPRAAIAAEDSRFCEHHGFDFQAIQKAMRHDERRPERLRGGSTISQQTAKNVFLWPDRSWVRKGFEAYTTVLIETIWGKRRIMEVYLNTVEMGPGVYGVEAAAQRYFHVSARNVSPAQAARLIAILPSPLKWQVIDPGAYVRRRDARIGKGEGAVSREGSDACVG
jgi:monofunctional biosynthetic peptidoglycan transglycosylase